MIHLISTSSISRIQQALEHANKDDWVIFSIEHSLSGTELSIINREVFTKFPNCAFLCENPTSEQHINHADFINLCVEHVPVMTWY